MLVDAEGADPASFLPVPKDPQPRSTNEVPSTKVIKNPKDLIVILPFMFTHSTCLALFGGVSVMWGHRVVFEQSDYVMSGIRGYFYAEVALAGICVLMHDHIT